MTRPRAVLADGASLNGAMLRRLFVGQCLVLAVHLFWMPLWLAGLALTVAAWRYLQLRGRLSQAGWLTRLMGVALLLGALWAQYGALRGLESLIGLLLGVYLLKLLETATRRDGRVVVCVGFVALTAAFLHGQSLFMALVGLGIAAWLIATLVGLAGATDGRRIWRETAWLLGLAAPLMLALFMLFPRLPPLWNLPQIERGTTGLSDSVTPGAIAELSRSDRRAFRVSFDGPVPPRSERYWRVYTLSRFDGRTWSRLSSERFADVGQRSPFAVADDEPRYRLELLLEPDRRPWRPSLGTPITSDRLQRYLADGTLEGLAPLASRSLLTLEASARAPGYVDPGRLHELRQLPPGNPRARALAQRLWRMSGGEPRRYLAWVMVRYAEAPFRYTLTPPRLDGRDSIDAFLFESQAGYCTHYASATAWLARAVGIPARLVAGFLGGERHPDGHFTLRDYDAHAWVEVWLEGRWQRLDPTTAIAPERIEQGPQAVAGAEQAFLADAPFSPLRLRGIGWFEGARLGWERLEYRWQRNVIGYQSESRRDVLAWLIEHLKPVWQALWHGRPGMSGMGWIAVLGMLAVAWVLVRLGRGGWAPRRDETALIQRLQARLERRGYPSYEGESPAVHLRRVAASSGSAGQVLHDAAMDAERLAYAPLNDDERRLRQRRLAAVTRRVHRLLPRRH